MSDLDQEIEYVRVDMEELRHAVVVMSRDIVQLREELQAEKTRRQVLSGRVDRSEYR